MVDPVKHTFEMGQCYPYDASDSWWRSSNNMVPPPARDWAHAAARAVLADLSDRRGIKREFEGIEEGVRAEIVDSLAAVIRYARAIVADRANDIGGDSDGGGCD